MAMTYNLINFPIRICIIIRYHFSIACCTTDTRINTTIIIIIILLIISFILTIIIILICNTVIRINHSML